MHSSEPPPSRWELHGRMFGAEIRVQLLFWLSCVLAGVIYYRDPGVCQEVGSFAAFVLWMAVAVLSLLAHELGHIIASRLFGARPRLLLSGLGGQLFGLETLKRWRRLLVFAAGPLANLLLYGVFWALTDPRFPLPRNWRLPLAPAVWLMMWINSYWCLLNLLPLWPLDGGRFAVDLGEGLLGRSGRTLALLFSLAVDVALMFFVIAWMRVSLLDRFDPRYPIRFGYFCVLSLYCYVFWVSAFRALWDDAEVVNPNE